MGWFLRVVEFGIAQICVRLLGAITGILIVRSLGKTEFAIYAIAFQMQVSCSLLADLGIGIGVRSIGGKVWGDREKFGELIATALNLRKAFAILSILVCVPVSLWMLVANGASVLSSLVICVVVVAGVVPLLSFTVLNSIPQFHKKYRHIQKRDVTLSLVRLALVSCLAFTQMNAILLAFVGAVGNWLQFKMTSALRPCYSNPFAKINASYNAELKRLSKQQFPNAVFFCFQGQITLLILSWYANSSGVAEITAISRIGVFVSILIPIFANLISPRFSQMRPGKRQRQVYFLIVILTFLAVLVFVITSRIFPEQILYVIGDKYSHLSAELPVLLGATGVATLGSIIWLLNNSRGWIRWNSILFIPATVLAQLVSGFLLDLSHVGCIALFILVTATIRIPIFLIDGVVGLTSELGDKNLVIGEST